LRGQGVTFLTFRDFYDVLLRQEKRDIRLPPRGVLLALSGVTGENVREVSDALASAGVRATLFLSTKHVGLTGVTEKTLLTLLANGFDVQSGGHTGEDLRSLTDSQLDAEFLQSRRLLGDLTKKTIFVVLYPSGGVNERVMQHAAKAGYLLGIGAVPERAFTRSQFLRLPSYLIGKGMTEDDIVRIVKGN
ncbi:polysaccharide deacetylase family protein, partial [Candidatus Peregrinibacteria bacterium]|nr:polysaccharide deacetylase family protein [Candidatus Peregrinibacteria bacterium]